MSNNNLFRNAWFDGENVTQAELDLEQTAWHDTIANSIGVMSGSGVELEYAIPRVLLDTDNVPSSVTTLINTNNFDGTPIFQNDISGLPIYSQPSDSTNGDFLDVTISGSSLVGSLSLKVYIFGLTFGGAFSYEVLTFTRNESQITRQYFTNIMAIMTQNFLGNSNTAVDGYGCRSVGGRLVITEAVPMTVVRDPIMVQQIVEPNLDFVNFIPAVVSNTLEDLLIEIAAVQDRNFADLGIVTSAPTTPVQWQFSPNYGLMLGQKFPANTNNLQKISMLLSVAQNPLAIPGHQYDWSGSIVLGVRALQTSVSCPTDTVPSSAIEFDPQPSELASVSFSQSDLANLGVVLDSIPQVVDFVFTQSVLANPAVTPEIVAGKYYIFTLSRTGNTSTGTIVTPVASVQDSSTYMSVFANNVWTDTPMNSLWFKIYTNAVRVTNGTAVDGGIQVTSQKTVQNNLGVTVPNIDGHHSLIDVASTTQNYVILQSSQSFSDQIPSPITGTPTFSEVSDVPDISVVNTDTLDTLLGSGAKTIVLGAAIDNNPVGNVAITGNTNFPGLVGKNTFTIINPSSDFIVNNVVGSVLVPDIGTPGLQYRIIASQLFTDAYGDVNGDGEINGQDVLLATSLDGYSLSLDGVGSPVIPSATQVAAVESGAITMPELIRCAVAGNNVISVNDASDIQQFISNNTAFVVGSSFRRLVLTVESLVNPLSISANMIGDNPLFNIVPFSPIGYRVELVVLWEPENIVITDLRRYVPITFTEISNADLTGAVPNGGSNTEFVPGNLLVGGQILNVNKTPYNLDYEVATIVINLPAGSTQGSLDVFNNFVKGKMKFSDGTVVSTGALQSNQVFVSAAIQSFVKNFPPGTYGLADDYNDGYFSTNETVAVLYTQAAGLLRVRANNITLDSSVPELSTKIILTVYLKKAGFKNAEQDISPAEVTNLITPI